MTIALHEEKIALSVINPLATPIINLYGQKNHEILEDCF